MSKGKTILKFSAAILLLGGSIATFVTYFPHITLAIQSGVVISIAPMVIFAISAIVALSSLIGLGVLTVSAIRSNGKSNEVGKKLKSESQDEGKSLVKEEEKAKSTSQLLPQKPKKSANTAQQPVEDLVKETNTFQSKKFVDNGYTDEQTEYSLPSITYTESLDSLIQNQPFPNPPAANSIHNGSEDESNPVQNHNSQTSMPMVNELKRALREFKIDRLSRPSTCKENQEYDSLNINQTTQYLNHLRRSKSLPNLEHTVTVEQQNMGEDQSDGQGIQVESNPIMTVSNFSWGGDFDDSSMPSLPYSGQYSMSQIIENGDVVTTIEENTNTHLQQPIVNQINQENAYSTSQS